MIIQKNEFIKLIKEYQEFLKLFDILYNKLKIDIISSDFHEYPCKLFDLIIYKSFNEVGQDLISYYLYEIPLLDEGNHVIEDENGKFPLNNVDDLWNLVKDERI